MKAALATDMGAEMNDDSCNACHICLDKTQTPLERMMRWMVLCPVCGNKRCPKATDHNLCCTNSNLPGQFGSIYA